MQGFCKLALPGAFTAIVVTTSVFGSLGSKGKGYPRQTSRITVSPVPIDLKIFTISLCVKPNTQVSLTYTKTSPENQRTCEYNF